MYKKTKTASFSLKIDPALLAQFDALVEGGKRGEAIRDMIKDRVARNETVVVAWIAVVRPGGLDEPKCAKCAQKIDFEDGALAPILSNGSVGSVYCKHCAN